MNRKPIAIGFTLLFMIVAFSGCNEVNEAINYNSFSQYVEISNVKVTTIWQKSFNVEDVQKKDGFYHDFPIDNSTYEVSGTIKNIGSKLIDEVSIKVIFYNSEGNELKEETSSINNLNLGESRIFQVKMLGYMPNFENVESYKLIVSDVYFHS